MFLVCSYIGGWNSHKTLKGEIWARLLFSGRLLELVQCLLQILIDRAQARGLFVESDNV